MKAIALLIILLLTGTALTGDDTGPHPPAGLAVPPDSPLRERWSDFGIPWRAGDLGLVTNYLISDGVLVTAGYDQVTSIDADTGKILWRYRPPTGGLVSTWSAAAGIVVIGTERVAGTTTGQYTGDTLYLPDTLALDQHTGRMLWRRSMASMMLRPWRSHGDQPDRLLPAGNTIVIPLTHIPTRIARGLIGVNPRTGTIAWTEFLSDLPTTDLTGCHIATGGDYRVDVRPLVVADEHIAAAAVACRHGNAIVGLDPQSGTVRWVTPLRATPSRLLMDKSTILVGQSGRGVLLDITGRILSEESVPPEHLLLAVTGNTAVISGHDGTDNPVAAVDLVSGRLLWRQRRPSGEPENMLDNTYYALYPAEDSVLAVPEGNNEPGFDSINAATGEIRPISFPVDSFSKVIAIRGSRLLARTSAGVTAFETRPGWSPARDYAAAPPTRWPDVCALLTDDQIAALRPHSALTRTPTSRTGSPQFSDRSTTCVLSDRNSTLATLTLTVADDTRIADFLFEDRLGSQSLLPDWDFPVFGSARGVTFGLGPLLATINTEDEIFLPATELANLIVRNLRTSGFG